MRKKNANKTIYSIGSGTFFGISSFLVIGYASESFNIAVVPAICIGLLAVLVLRMAWDIQ